MDHATTHRLHIAGALVVTAVLAIAAIFCGKMITSTHTAGAALPQGDRTAEVLDTVAAADATPEAAASEASKPEPAPQITEHIHPTRVPILPPEQIDTETLWLARCIYSETKRPEEQELVAWVVRNRVESGYRGKRSYRSVVLDPYQFSAFNPQSRKRQYYMNLDRHTDAPGWERALSIAFRVRHASPELNPFPESTRHFFSERSMADRRHPNWAHGRSDVKPDRYRIAKERFRFYSNVM